MKTKTTQKSTPKLVANGFWIHFSDGWGVPNPLYKGLEEAIWNQKYGILTKENLNVLCSCACAYVALLNDFTDKTAIQKIKKIRAAVRKLNPETGE